MYLTTKILIHALPSQVSWCYFCRDKALAAVKIKQEEVDLIVSELEVDKRTATKALREHQGDLVAALNSFLKV